MPRGLLDHAVRPRPVTVERCLRVIGGGPARWDTRGIDKLTIKLRIIYEPLTSRL